MTQLDYKSTAKRWQKYSETYLREARVSFIRSIDKIITISVFSMGFLLTWLQIQTNHSSLTTFDKIIVIVSMISFLTSIIMGLWCHITINKMMNKFGTDYGDKSYKLNAYMLDTGKETGEEYPNYLWGDTEYEFLPKQWIIQIISFGIGIISSVGLVMYWILQS